MTLFENTIVIGSAPRSIGEATVKMLEASKNQKITLAPERNEMDVRQTGHIDRYLRQSITDYGRDYEGWNIVYCAGVNKLERLHDIMPQDYRNMMDVNVIGFVTFVSYALHRIKGRLNIVAVSSDAGERPLRTSTMYCSSKAALNMAVRCMARELAPRHRVNAVAPGMVDGTAMTDYIDQAVPVIRGWDAEYARDYERSQIPQGRRADREEIAQAICLLLGGPTYQTGSIVTINGGRS